MNTILVRLFFFLNFKEQLLVWKGNAASTPTATSNCNESEQSVSEPHIAWLIQPPLFLYHPCLHWASVLKDAAGQGSPEKNIQKSICPRCLVYRLRQASRLSAEIGFTFQWNRSSLLFVSSSRQHFTNSQKPEFHNNKTQLWILYNRSIQTHSICIS